MFGQKGDKNISPLSIDEAIQCFWSALTAGQWHVASEAIASDLLGDLDRQYLLPGILGFAFEREAASDLDAAIRIYKIALTLKPDDLAIIQGKITILSALAVIELVDQDKDAYTIVNGIDLDASQREAFVSTIAASAHMRECTGALGPAIALLKIADFLAAGLPIAIDVAKRLSSVTGLHVATLASRNYVLQAVEVLDAFLKSANEMERDICRYALLAFAQERENASELHAALACFRLALRLGNCDLIEQRVRGLALLHASRLLQVGRLEECEVVLQTENERLLGGMATEGTFYLHALRADRADAERLTAEAEALRSRRPEEAALLLRRADALRPTAGAEAPPREGRLLILDTCFPSTLSSFRYDEFVEYLRAIPRSEALSSVWDVSRFVPDARFGTVLNEFAASEPALADRVKSFHYLRSFDADLAYTVFLNNAVSLWLDNPRRGACPLAFTLYPGGGFDLEDEASDAKLRRLLNDAKAKRVVTTQRITYDYLTSKGFCDPRRITHIFGGVVSGCFEPQPPPSAIRPEDGPLDVCFVAQRYTPKGVEKGCDVFTKVVQAFTGDTSVRFHYVGGWTPENVGLTPMDGVTFHGVQPRSFFREFYRRMHLMISPNVSLYQLDGRGSFDGFPTTVCVEAGAEGVGLLMTDSLGSNRSLDGRPIFAEGREFVKISRDAEEIAAHVRRFTRDREGVRSMSELGRAAILREFSFARQMLPRIALIEAEMALGPVGIHIERRL